MYVAFNRSFDAWVEARKKHPHFADDINHAMSLLMEEVGELAKAINDGDVENARVEMAQVIAVLVRMDMETEFFSARKEG